MGWEWGWQMERDRLERGWLGRDRLDWTAHWKMVRGELAERKERDWQEKR